MRLTRNACLFTPILLFLFACERGEEPRTTPPDASLPSADGSERSPPDGKLPAGVRPTAYRLHMTLDPRRDDFSGEVAIDLSIENARRTIWLHGRKLRVDEVSLSTPDGTLLSGRYEQLLDSGVSAVTFDDAVPAGDATLTLRYRADFDRNLAGLFKVEEQGEAYVLAKSESIQARSYLPGFDEPGLKASFDVVLDIPHGYEAIGNSPVVEQQALDDDMQRLTFATTPPMSTYLLSLAVGPFDIVEREAIPPNDMRDRPIPLRGVARKGRGDDLAYILDVTPRMVEIFERELRQPYPFAKLDIVAAPQWPSGATELSAAITYREQRILVGDDPAPGARLSLLRIHAHEIAHMWFGNLVTPPWWDDLWLKEGFATWATPVVLTLLEPDGGHELNGAERALGAMQLDSLASTRAIREAITDNDEIRNAYDAITYSKSLGVIHMVDQYFGPDVFRPALGRYIESFADGAADSPAFYRVIGEETGTPALTDTFRGFVEQTGVPLLQAVLDCGSGEKPTLTLGQRRYKALGSPIDDADKRWTIPVCVRTDQAEHCTMMTDVEQDLALGDACPAFVMPNASGSGYYRWTLDDAGWEALLDHFDALSAVEALSLIDSAFAAFEAGLLEPPQLLRVIGLASRAEARQVVTAPLPHLRRYVMQHFSPQARARFEALASELYQPVLDAAAGRSDDDAKLLYSELLQFMALTAGNPEARERLRVMAHAFTGFERARDADALPSDLYFAALAVAVEDSGEAFLSHLLAFRGELDDPLFENESANAIGLSNDPQQLDTLHALALGDELGPRETFGMMNIALSDSALREQHWQWLRANVAAFVEQVPTQWRRRLPRLAASFCSEEKRGELRTLIEANADLVPGYGRSLRQTDERIRLCIALKERTALLADAMSAS